MSENSTNHSDGTGDDVDFIYCRYRRCGKRLLDAHAYGLKAWRLRIRRNKQKED